MNMNFGKWSLEFHRKLILHEMLHALFILYACHYDGCYTWPENCAQDEHGPAFREVREALKAATQMHFGVAIDVGEGGRAK